MPQYVKRITLFNVPKEEDIDKVLAQYEVLRKTAEKVQNAPTSDLPALV